MSTEEVWCVVRRRYDFLQRKMPFCGWDVFQGKMSSTSSKEGITDGVDGDARTVLTVSMEVPRRGEATAQSRANLRNEGCSGRCTGLDVKSARVKMVAFFI